MKFYQKSSSDVTHFLQMIDLSEIYHIVCCISGTVLVTEFFMADAKLVFIKINNRLIRPVKVGLDLEKIAIEGFVALTCLLGPSGPDNKLGTSGIWLHRLLGEGCELQR